MLRVLQMLLPQASLLLSCAAGKCRAPATCALLLPPSPSPLLLLLLLLLLPA